MTVEVASLLYAGGAPAAVWRHWCGLAGHGLALLDRRRAACAFLVLGGQWAVLAGFRDAPPGAGAPDALALWQIAVAPAAADELPDTDDMDRAWLELIEAIPAADHKAVDRALTELAVFWIGEGDDDWDRYRPRVAPIFQPEVCAAAALAIRHGYRPGQSDEDVRRFLEPGLMPGFPEPVEW